jgi:hypothetical protein
VQITSRLSDTTLGDVLGALHRGRVSGQVRLTERGGSSSLRVHGIFLSQGDVVGVDSQIQVPMLGDILRQRGLLDGATQRRVGLKLASSGLRIGELLVEECHVSPEVVGAALRQQLRARLDALFRLTDAILSFHVACAIPRASVPPLVPREYLHGRARARDRAPRSERKEDHRVARAKVASSAAREAALAMLGLDADASVDEVTRAFRALARTLHPDRLRDATEAERRRAEQRFGLISAAYHKLIG